MTRATAVAGRAPAARALKWLVASSALPYAGAIIFRYEPPVTIDSHWQFLAMDVGLEPGSTVSIDLHCERRTNNTYIMMLTHSQLLAWHQVEPETLVSLDGAATDRNSYLTSAWRMVFADGAKAKFRINAPVRDRYHIGVLNAQALEITFSGEIAMVNPNGQQLRVQDVGTPSVLLMSAAIFAFSCACIMAALLKLWRRSCTIMHFIIAAVILLKGICLFLRWLDILQVSRSGTDSLITGVGWQLVEKIQSIMELMMFLLIALGWKFLRNTLNVTEVRFAIGISAISFYLGVFEIACTSASTCSGYQLSRYILHSLCDLVVIVAMNFNLQMIHAQLLDAPASEEAGRLYSKWKAYKAFRWVFLVVIVAPTAELFLKVSVMPWDAQWISVLVHEIRAWAIYVCVFYYFRPNPKPMRVFELTRDVGEDDDDDGEVAEAGE